MTGCHWSPEFLFSGRSSGWEDNVTAEYEFAHWPWLIHHIAEAETTTELDGIIVKQLPLTWNARKETPQIILVLSWRYSWGRAVEQHTGCAGRSAGAEQQIQTRNPHRVHLFSRAGAKANLMETWAFCSLAEAQSWYALGWLCQHLQRFIPVSGR